MTAEAMATISARLRDLRRSKVVRLLAHGTAWSFLGATAGRVLGLVTAVLLARVVGVVEFGAFGMVQSSMLMATTFAAFGLGLTATKHVAEFRSTDPSRLTAVIGLTLRFATLSGGVISGALFLFSPVIADRVLEQPSLSIPLRLAAPALMFAALNTVQTGVLAGFQSFKRIAASSAIQGALGLSILPLFAIFGGVDAAAAGLALQGALSCAFTAVLVRREMKASGVSSRAAGAMKEWRLLTSYSLPAFASGVLVVPVTWVCTAIIVARPGGLTEIAIFGAANQWFTAVLFLPTIVSQVLMPWLTIRVSIDGATASRRVLMFSVIANAVVVGPVVLTGVLLAPHLMRMYGSDFRPGSTTLVLSLATAALVSLQAPIGQLLAATNQMWLGAATNLAWAALFISMTIALASNGAIGLATARLVAYLGHGLWSGALLWWVLNPEAAPRQETAPPAGS